MNQAMRRSLRPWHLLLLVPLLVASTPAAPPKPEPLRGLFLTDLRLALHTPPIAGEQIRFTVTAIDEEGLVFSTYTGTVNVTITDTLNGASVQPPSHLFVGGNGIGEFQARWPRAGTQKIIVKDTLGLVTREYPVNVMPGPAIRLEFQLPQSVQAGMAVGTTVTALDANGNRATGFTGPVIFESSNTEAILPTGASFTALDQGQKVFSGIIFTQRGPQTLTIKTGSNSLSTTRNINVLPGPATRFLIRPSVTVATAGVPFSAQITPVDAYNHPTDYPPGQIVQFTSTDPDAVLPGPMEFRMGQFEFTLRTAGLQNIGIADGNNLTGRVPDGIRVEPGLFQRILLSTPTAQPVDTCAPAMVQLRAVDPFNNTVPGVREVLLCGTPGGAVRYIDSTLDDAIFHPSTGCVDGALPATGMAQVRWSNTAAGTVSFEIEQLEFTSVAITFRTGGLNPASSRLSFPDALQDPPLLRTFTGTQRVLFEPRNTCNEPVDPPAGQTLNIAVQSPLAREAAAVREELGRWSTTVRLPKCPDTGAAALKIGPTLNGEPLLLPTGAPLRADILPNCLPPDVLLELEAKDSKATPGAEVKFELTLTNTGDAVIPAGMLWLETASITALEASLDGTKLDTSSMKLSFPELAPGTARTVKLEGLAGTQLDVKVTLTAWYTTVEGAALTEQKAASLDWDDLAANVGCGCQTGALPSQFLPWLALLAVASRARARLRRLTQGERIDR